MRRAKSLIEPNHGLNSGSGEPFNDPCSYERLVGIYLSNHHMTRYPVYSKLISKFTHASKTRHLNAVHYFVVF